jgi:hypothetical protein
MGSKLAFFITIVLFSALNAIGQDSLKFVAFETGIDFIGCESVEKDYIRDTNSDLNGIFAPRMRSEMQKAFVSVKIEKRTSNDRFGFLTGLRFTHLNSRIIKSGFPNFLYFLLRQTGTTTEYLKVKELNEISNYLGIPLEVRFFPYKQRRFRLYFMAGGELSYQLTTKTNVLFDDKTMEIYQSSAEEIVGKSSTWYAAFYARAGFILGKEKPRIGIGISAPVVITNTVSSLNTPVAGGGVQIQFQMPF